MNKILVEVCADSTCSAIEAQEGGANRIELCINLAEGGTTPPLSQIQLTSQKVNIPIHILIRPRGGNFLYNNIEFEAMKMDIHLCGQKGCDGVVFGILNADGSIDIKRNKELAYIAKAYGMSITFHRAFDHCQDLSTSLEKVIDLGCNRILTSGGKKTASEGMNDLRKLIEQAGNRIIIMPGGGITEDNISDLIKVSGLKEFHGSFRKYCNNADVMQTNADRVRHVIEQANNQA